MMSGQKSVVIAYLLWLFGGIFGCHHFYLRRDRHGFVWGTTLGGFLVGWLFEMFSIPRYVRYANEEYQLMAELHKKRQCSKQPPFSMNRFSGMLAVGYSWGQMMMLAVPGDTVYGLEPKHISLLIPLVVALGVWTVGNIGSQQGGLRWPLLGAYLAYPLRYYVYDEVIWFTAMVLVSGLAFDSFSKEWRYNVPKKRGFIRRASIIGICAILYLSMWGSYLYHHGTITDSDGEEIPLYDAVHHLFTTSWWSDIKQCLVETYNYAQHHGWYEVWNQIVDMSYPHTDENAYLILGVTPFATQQEITSAWRKLSRENHPDKVKDPLLQKAAHEKFLSIQQAYEIVSNSRLRRSRRNKKDNSEPRDHADL